MKLTIRKMESLDIGNIKKLMLDFEAELKNEYPKMDAEELDKKLMQILININNPNYIYLIAYDGKKPAGFFAGYIGQHAYGKPNRIGVAQELFVKREKRNKFVGFKLIKEAVKLGLQQGIEGFECIGTYNNTDKRWERYGFKLHLTYGHMSLSDAIKLVQGREHENNQENSY